VAFGPFLNVTRRRQQSRLPGKTRGCSARSAEAEHKIMRHQAEKLRQSVDKL
jgi:hypothetical protein